MKPDQVRLHAVLSDTVGILCKSALIFERKLAIQAVIGITVDENDVFLVHIDRQFGNCSINSVPPATITGNAIRQDDQLVKEIKNDRVVSFESTTLDPINRRVNDINRSQLKNSGMKLKRQHTDCKFKALSKQLLHGGSGKSRKRRECNLLLSSNVGRETGISTILSKASNKEEPKKLCELPVMPFAEPMSRSLITVSDMAMSCDLLQSVASSLDVPAIQSINLQHLNLDNVEKQSSSKKTLSPLSKKTFHGTISRDFNQNILIPRQVVELDALNGSVDCIEDDSCYIMSSAIAKPNHDKLCNTGKDTVKKSRISKPNDLSLEALNHGEMNASQRASNVVTCMKKMLPHVYDISECSVVLKGSDVVSCNGYIRKNKDTCSSQRPRNGHNSSNNSGFNDVLPEHSEQELSSGEPAVESGEQCVTDCMNDAIDISRFLTCESMLDNCHDETGNNDNSMPKPNEAESVSNASIMSGIDPVNTIQHSSLDPVKEKNTEVQSIAECAIALGGGNLKSTVVETHANEKPANLIKAPKVANNIEWLKKAKVSLSRVGASISSCEWSGSQNTAPVCVVGQSLNGDIQASTSTDKFAPENEAGGSINNDAAAVKESVSLNHSLCAFQVGCKMTNQLGDLTGLKETDFQLSNDSVVDEKVDPEKLANKTKQSSASKRKASGTESATHKIANGRKVLKEQRNKKKPSIHFGSCPTSRYKRKESMWARCSINYDKVDAKSGATSSNDSKNDVAAVGQELQKFYACDPPCQRVYKSLKSLKRHKACHRNAAEYDEAHTPYLNRYKPYDSKDCNKSNGNCSQSISVGQHNRKTAIASDKSSNKFKEHCSESVTPISNESKRLGSQSLVDVGLSVKRAASCDAANLVFWSGSMANSSRIN